MGRAGRAAVSRAAPAAASLPSSVDMAGIPGAVTYYTAAGAPNPAFVEMFAAEKGIDLLSLAHVIDLGGGTNYHRSGEYAKKNPAGGTPYLEFEDGTVISETVVLCELLDSAHPSTSLPACAPDRCWTDFSTVCLTGWH